MKWVLTVGVICVLASNTFGMDQDEEKALEEFSKIPVLELGRYKPWDSVARNSLLLLHERQEFRTDEGTLKAIQWLGELLFDAPRADQRQVFRVVHPDVRILLGNTTEDQKFFSYQEILKYLIKLEKQSKQASKLEPQLRNPYQRAIVTLDRNVRLYQSLKHTFKPPGTTTLHQEIGYYKIWSQAPLTAFQSHQKGEAYDNAELQNFFQVASVYKSLSELSQCFPIPPPRGENDEDWMSVWDIFVKLAPTGNVSREVALYADLSDHYREGNWMAFTEISHELRSLLAKNKKEAVDKATLEASFNRSELFYNTSILYVIIFMIVMLSWVKWQAPLTRVAFWLVVLALVLHTSGLIIRMVIQGRPPVTNLYSSALFVGWGGTVLGLVLERLFKNGIGAATSSVVGFMSLIVAHNLAGDGDTMAMLQAVLDTNFWLATHVVVITFGYSATFIAGFLAIMYIFFGFFTKLLTEEREQALEKMVYGIVCFALLFSFVGTVLGGIWADQSWGRFWGWDPKENGALLIVIWNAMILHARWGKMIASRGVMVAAVFGNIVTAWSWFGTNMLGVGLHSYGFMDRAFFWLIAFGFFMVMMMAIGSIPMHLWESIASRKKKNKSV